VAEPIGEHEVKGEQAAQLRDPVGVQQDSVRWIENSGKRRMKIRGPLATKTRGEIGCLAGLSGGAWPPQRQKLRELFERSNRRAGAGPVARLVAHASHGGLAGTEVPRDGPVGTLQTARRSDELRVVACDALRRLCHARIVRRTARERRHRRPAATGGVTSCTLRQARCPGRFVFCMRRRP